MILRHALVTGASGFIGRHMTKKLEQEGYYVTTCDIKDDSDMLDFLNISPALHMYDVVVHCAATIGGRMGIERYRTHLGAYNMMLDNALIDWALRAKPKALVLFSSSAVYPVALQTADTGKALRECDQDPYAPALPDETYGWTKLSLERMAKEYVRDTSRACYVVRPFSGYGTDQDTTYPFRSFLERALSRENPFTVWGDGQQIRDWIHVDDIITAIFRMMQLEMYANAVPVNLGNGIPVKFIDLAEMFIKEIGDGYTASVKTLTDKPSGVSVRYCENNRLRDFYEPRISILDGIQRAIKERQ